MTCDVIDLIMELPTNQRIATYLSGVLEWTGPEIAEVLDIAPATAYVHVSRGIQAIRDNGYKHGEGTTAKASSSYVPREPMDWLGRPDPSPFPQPTRNTSAWEIIRELGFWRLVLLVAIPVILVFLISLVDAYPWLELWLILAGCLVWAISKARHLKRRGEIRKPRRSNRHATPVALTRDEVRFVGRAHLPRGSLSSRSGRKSHRTRRSR